MMFHTLSTVFTSSWNGPIGESLAALWRPTHGSFTKEFSMTFHIRWMIQRDLEEILAIENASFDFPWVKEDFLRSLGQRNRIGMVVEIGEHVRGFMIYEINRSSIKILNLAVQECCRRESLGSQMVSRVIGKLSSHQRTEIRVHVRETNLAAQMFFRSQGFLATGVCRGHYENNGEDAYCMKFTHASQPEWSQYALAGLPKAE
jgi:[ribosomal protein S18]-alanine N-acetyltransferase